MAIKGGGRVLFNDCYEQSKALKDPPGFTIRAPSIGDLINLKHCKTNLSAKDKEDIEYLKIKKSRRT